MTRAGLHGALQEVQAALAPTPFTACTGESLAASRPSLLAVRPASYWDSAARVSALLSRMSVRLPAVHVRGITCCGDRQRAWVGSVPRAGVLLADCITSWHKLAWPKQAQAFSCSFGQDFRAWCACCMAIPSDARQQIEMYGRAQAHQRAWYRTMAAGRPAAGRAALALWLMGNDACLWLLCVYMALLEWWTLGDWLQRE